MTTPATAPVDPASVNTPVDEVVKRLAHISDNMAAKSTVDELRAQLDEAKAQMAAISKQLRDRSFSLPGVESEASNYSLSRAILANGMVDPSMSDDQKIATMRKYAPLEFDISEQTRKANSQVLEQHARDLVGADKEKARATNTTLTDSAGGFLVPAQLLAKFYEIFYANLVLDEAGATKLTGLMGEPVLVPKEASGTTAYMAPENSITGLTNSEPTFQMLQLRAREVVATGSYSQRLLSLANPSIDQMLINCYMRKLALKVEQQIFVGKGSNGEVRGILTGAGGTGANFPHLEGTLQDVTDRNLANGSNTITPAIVVDFEGDLQDADALQGSLAIISHPKVYRKFRKDTTNQYVMPSPLTQQRVQEITGYKWLITTQLPTTLNKSAYTGDGTALAHFMLGNWNDLLIGLWGGIMIRRSDVAYSPITSTSAFHQRLVHVLVSQLFDAGVIRAASISASNEVVAS